MKENARDCRQFQSSLIIIIIIKRVYNFIWIIGGVFFDLRKSAKLHFWPTQNPLYYTFDLLAQGFAAAKWTCGRSAWPPSLS